MAKAKVNQDECVTCGSCEGVCPASAITIEDKAVVDEAKCTECGQCAEACPVGAISN